MLFVFLAQMRINQAFPRKTWRAEVQYQGQFEPGGLQVRQGLSQMRLSDCGCGFKLKNNGILSNDIEPVFANTYFIRSFAQSSGIAATTNVLDAWCSGLGMSCRG